MRRSLAIRPLHSPILGILGSITLSAIIGLSAIASDKKKDGDQSEHKEPKTIGDIVSVAGLSSYPVEGVGLIVGLDETGSDPLPGNDRNLLLQDMQKRGISHPDEVLRSTNSALVKVRAKIPPAVRSCKTAGCWCKDKTSKKSDGDILRPHKGDTFDVEVEAPTRDGTTSLKGGWLLETWLFETADLPGAGTLSGHTRAKASGPVLVTGGLDGQPANPADLKRGRVLGGGIATEDRGFALITDTDRTARWTIQIANRINDRFPNRTREGKAIAEPKDGQRILLRIPPRYRQNMARYLDVLRYMPLSQDASQESDRMDRYAEDLSDPNKARIAVLKLEGIGHRASESLKEALNSSDPDVRFFAAESLAYLDDPKAADTLTQSAREIPEYRAHALTALSSLDEPIAPLKLHELMSDSNSVELRYGAFRALRALDPADSTIVGESVGDEMFLHQVSSSGNPFIHVSSRDRAEVVLFGRDLQFQTPLLLKVGSKITLHAEAGDESIVLSRYVRGEPDRHLKSSLKIRDIVRKAVGMGATYPDIVAMLVQADKQHNLPGHLALDAVPDPALLVTRLQRNADKGSKPPENVAMPNLFRWTESRKSVKDHSDDDGEAGSRDSDKAKEKTYVSKPTMLDRLMRRTGN
jgi:flagellar basal body P-ring protein FlgI